MQVGQLLGEAKRSKCNRKKKVRSQEKKPLLKFTGCTSINTLSTSAERSLTLVALHISSWVSGKKKHRKSSRQSRSHQESYTLPASIQTASLKAASVGQPFFKSAIKNPPKNKMVLKLSQSTSIP